MNEYLKSTIDVLGLAKDAGKLIVAKTIGKLDTWLADQINGPGDQE